MTRKNGRIKQKLQPALIYLYPAAFFLILLQLSYLEAVEVSTCSLMEHLPLSIELQRSAGTTAAKTPNVLFLNKHSNNTL